MSPLSKIRLNFDRVLNKKEEEIRRRQCRFPTFNWVGTRHCRLLYIIPVQPEIRRRQCRFPTINWGRDTALPSPLYYSGATRIDMTSLQKFNQLLQLQPRFATQQNLLRQNNSSLVSTQRNHTSHLKSQRCIQSHNIHLCPRSLTLKNIP